MIVTNVTKENSSDLRAAATIRSAFVTQVDGVPNAVAQVLRSGAPKPHATVPNSMVAAVDQYTPPPGRNMAHYLTLDVDKAGNGVTSIADALQRYLDVKPRREAEADPRSMAATDAYPTLIMDEDEAWANSFPYQFSLNGVVQKQIQPNFYSASGALRARILGVGISSIKTPATEPDPSIPVGPSATRSMYYPPEAAAQLAMSRIFDMYYAQGVPSLPPAKDGETGANGSIKDVAETLADERQTSQNGDGENIRTALNRYIGLNVLGQTNRLYTTSLTGRLV
ncbi:MAG: hypothetical protein LBI10_07260 [Deltaproteobacteria bacterium]|jgi:hypothetical protein|nr:hypothetical protein [Deltaproteobacteria bacterium]